MSKKIFNLGLLTLVLLILMALPVSTSMFGNSSVVYAAKCKSGQVKNKKGKCVDKPKPKNGVDPGTPVSKPKSLNAPDTDYATGLPQTPSTNDQLQNILQIALGIIGAVAVLFVIIGGLRYILAGDDSQATARARGTILYAVVGGIIVIAAEIIVSFVLDKL